MNEKIEQVTRGAVALPAVAAQLSFPAWWPGIDAASDFSAKLVPIIGLMTGLIYLCVAGVNLWVKIRKARAVRHD